VIPGRRESLSFPPLSPPGPDDRLNRPRVPGQVGEPGPGDGPGAVDPAERAVTHVRPLEELGPYTLVEFGSHEFRSGEVVRWWING
jgi:hypothetical protein